MATEAFADRIDSEVAEMLGGNEMIEQPKLIAPSLFDADDPEAQPG